jgi:hypothetical protein
MTTITVTIFHNLARDPEGRHTAFTDGYRPGDPMVRVFTYQAEADGRSPEAMAEAAFEAFNADPDMLAGVQRDLATRYRRRMLRSLSVGDVVAIGEAALAVGRAGWTPVRGGLNEVRASEHGTHPLPARSRLPGTADHAAKPCPDQGATS